MDCIFCCCCFQHCYIGDSWLFHWKLYSATNLIIFRHQSPPMYVVPINWMIQWQACNVSHAANKPSSHHTTATSCQIVLRDINKAFKCSFYIYAFMYDDSCACAFMCMKEIERGRVSVCVIIIMYWSESRADFVWDVLCVTEMDNFSIIFALLHSYRRTSNSHYIVFKFEFIGFYWLLVFPLLWPFWAFRPCIAIDV